MASEEKPKKITVTITIPTKESILENIKQMFPMLNVEIEEETEEEEPAGTTP
jgi:hypothetical protein